MGCKDCPTGSKRAAPWQGPRCATHHKAEVKRLRRAAHARYIEKTYGISGEEYWAIYDYQGGKCYMCEWATGAKKLLAVDHDHACCPGKISCGKCVRGLLCGPCNQYLGRTRDSIRCFARGIMYIQNPPARKVLRR